MCYLIEQILPQSIDLPFSVLISVTVSTFSKNSITQIYVTVSCNYTNNIYRSPTFNKTKQNKKSHGPHERNIIKGPNFFLENSKHTPKGYVRGHALGNEFVGTEEIVGIGEMSGVLHVMHT